VLSRAEFVCRNLQNRSGIRALLACLLAKIHNPHVDVRKPDTEIGGTDAFSGRTYDERYISPFINKYKLPCNPTTAFLTPAFRNRNIVLTPDVNLVGRPPLLYKTLLLLLNDVYEGTVSAADLLTEIVRCLLIMRDEKRQWMESVIAGLKLQKARSLSQQRP
jgi:DNA adenine methylase